MKKEIGRTISYFRNKKGLTQMKLAKKIKTNRGIISQIENGTENPSLEQIQRIIDGLEISNIEFTQILRDFAIEIFKENNKLEKIVFLQKK